MTPDATTPGTDALLAASGLRGPALAALEGPSGLFALTGEELVYGGERGIRRVHLRDLARIHSDSEGTLRVETPAGVALSASLLGFDPDEVQDFFGQVQGVTARVKAQGGPRPAPTRPSVQRPPEPARGVSVTPVRAPDLPLPEGRRDPAPLDSAPKVTVTRRGQVEELPPTEGRPSTELRASPGSVQIRMVPPDAPRGGQDPAPLVVQAAPSPRLQSDPEPDDPERGDPEQDEQLEQEPQERVSVSRAPTRPQEAQHRKAAPPKAAPPKAAESGEPLTAEPDELAAQATKVGRQAGLLRLLGAALIVGSLIVAVLMFLNAQRPLAVWALVQGVVLGLALLSLSELARLQALQAALIAEEAESGG